MKTIRIITTILICFIPTVGQRVVRVTDPNAVNPAEVSIAINPKNPDNVIGASFQAGRRGQPRAGSYMYVSMDGGKTWRTFPTANPDQLVQGDDVVVFGSDGTAYHAHLSFDGIRVARPVRADNAITINTSIDNGVTWNDGVPTVRHINSVTPFEDKPGIVVDNAPNSRNKGNVYVAWTRFDVYGSSNPEHKSQIYFSRSTNGGKTFSAPIRISDTGGDCVDSDNTVEGAVPAVAPNGDVYVVWAGPLGLVFDKSTDGGLTFGEDKKISDFPGGWDFGVEGLSRANGMPNTGVDLSNGPNKGTLYVNWIDHRNGDPDVFVMASRDGGATWSEPTRVNDDQLKNGMCSSSRGWLSIRPTDQ